VLRNVIGKFALRAFRRQFNDHITSGCDARIARSRRVQRLCNGMWTPVALVT
jgi:hypothetical protein